MEARWLVGGAWWCGEPNGGARGWAERPSGGSRRQSSLIPKAHVGKNKFAGCSSKSSTFELAPLRQIPLHYELNTQKYLSFIGAHRFQNKYHFAKPQTNENPTYAAETLKPYVFHKWVPKQVIQYTKTINRKMGIQI